MTKPRLLRLYNEASDYRSKQGLWEALFFRPPGYAIERMHITQDLQLNQAAQNLLHLLAFCGKGLSLEGLDLSPLLIDQDRRYLANPPGKILAPLLPD